VDITTECKDTKGEIKCRVLISGFINELEISEEHKLSVRLKNTICDVCSKRFGGYHEAIVQIRTENKKLTSEEIENIITNVKNLIENLQAKGNRGLFITDIALENSGLNFYISEKGAALTIVKYLQEKSGGQFKQSSKNVGMKDSRQIYRMTYLLRLPAYKKGSLISLDNIFYYISSIHGNKVVIIELSKWKETTVDPKNLQNAKIIGGNKLIKEMIIVSQSSTEIQVMDPEKYDIKIVKKPKPVLFKSEKIKIVNIEDNMYIYPEINS
jgi:nonsense-mediated mRNA decay protein 3